MFSVVAGQHQRDVFLDRRRGQDRPVRRGQVEGSDPASKQTHRGTQTTMSHGHRQIGNYYQRLIENLEGLFFLTIIEEREGLH